MRSDRQKPGNHLEHMISTVLEYKNLVLLPVILCTLGALAYAVFKSNTYSAKQAILIRDDMMGQSFKPGQFGTIDMMKSAQETVLELSRKPQVIRKALAKLGPPSRFTSGWPTDDDTPMTRGQEKIIEQMQGSITFTAPNGAKFGETEVVLLNAKSSTRERAGRFVVLLLDEIADKISEVRSLRLKSMEGELTQAESAAMADLQTVMNELQEIESAVGTDLDTLRSLSDNQSSGGSLQQLLSQVRSELRSTESRIASAIEQRQLLVDGLQEPKKILVTSNDLLAMQPALDQLKTNLNQAQVALTGARSRYKGQHPQVISAEFAFKDIKQQINIQLPTIIKGLDSQIQGMINEKNRLVRHAKDYDSRLKMLSEKRVDYKKLDSEVAKKTENYNKIQSNLAEVRSLGKAAKQVDLITRVDNPQVNTKADGLGRREIVLGGLLGGIVIGLGLVSLAAPSFVDPNAIFGLGEKKPATQTDSISPNQPIVQETLSATVSSTAESEPLLNTRTAMSALERGAERTRKAAEGRPTVAMPGPQTIANQKLASAPDQPAQDLPAKELPNRALPKGDQPLSELAQIGNQIHAQLEQPPAPPLDVKPLDPANLTHALPTVTKKPPSIEPKQTPPPSFGSDMVASELSELAATALNPGAGNPTALNPGALIPENVVVPITPVAPIAPATPTETQMRPDVALPIQTAPPTSATQNPLPKLELPFGNPATKTPEAAQPTVNPGAAPESFGTQLDNVIPDPNQIKPPTPEEILQELVGRESTPVVVQPQIPSREIELQLPKVPPVADNAAAIIRNATDLPATSAEADMNPNATGLPIESDSNLAGVMPQRPIAPTITTRQEASTIQIEDVVSQLSLPPVTETPMPAANISSDSKMESDGASESTSAPRVNPFLNRPADIKNETQDPAPEIPPLSNPGTTATPVDDQIKKLSDSLSSFYKKNSNK